MIDPKIGEQLELFPETKPPEQKKKTKKSLSFLSEKEMEMIQKLADVVDQIQFGAREYEGEDLEEEKFEMLHHLRIEFGIPEWISKELIMPFYNVPNADREYLLEHLLESLNPKLYQKYLLEKEEQFKKLLKGDAS